MTNFTRRAARLAVLAGGCALCFCFGTIGTMGTTAGAGAAAAQAGGGAARGETVPHELRYLALGDSYTIGESVAVEGRWPVQLAALLRQAGLAVGEPEIVARTGWTVA
jgi:hypothetical protein